MKKIRTVEFWVATLLLLTYVVIYVHHGYQSVQKSSAGHLPFDLADYLQGNLSEGLLFYLSFLGITHVLVPRWWLTQKYTMALIWTVVSYFFIASLFTAISVYHKGLPGNQSGKEAFAIRSVMQQFVSTAIFYVMLTVYILLREVALYQYRRHHLSQTRAWRMMKEIACVVFVWLWLLNLFWGLNYEPFFRSFGVYYLINVPFGAALYFINLYGLIPVYNRTAGGGWWVYMVRLAAVVILWGLLETIFIKATPYNLSLIRLMLTVWVIPLFITVPLSWVVYQASENHYRKLTTLQAALDASDAKLQLLRSQINPHFLFNTLNTLYGTAIVDGSRRTAEGIQQLGDMMRFMLHDNQRDYIPLSSELAYLNNYLTLQRLRLNHSAIIIESEIDEDASPSLHIAPMLLIPLVENAFKHGIGPAEAKSVVQVQLQITGQRVGFVVSNSMHPMTGEDLEKEHSGIGLLNVSQRLKVYYPGRHRFEYGGLDSTFTARLTIDLDKSLSSHNLHFR